MTSSSETSQEMDLESQETGRGIPAPRKFFRRVAWVLLAVRALSSKAHSDKKENRDSPRVPLLSPSHLNLEEAEIERISPEDEVSIDVPCNDEAGDAAIVEKISKGPAIPALGNVLRSAILVAEIEKLSPEDEVSIEVPCNDEAGNAASDIKQQHENIANILKKRNLKSLHEFGGVKRVAEVLETDLENGITGDIEDLPLSLGFGIKEEGLRTGWYEGVIIILAIIILVIERAVRDFLGENPENLLEEQRQRRKGEMEVDVIRAGKQVKVPALDLVIGDIVSLERGCPIPGDGLFVSGKDLKLDDSFQSDVNEQNPFLFYGSKVIEGQGNMLVTSMGLNTKLGEMISKASKSRRLPAQLDKLLLVRCLKQQGHIVAFVGGRTDDAPSLKEADVGIVTGTAGSSELVNGSSELIILDGNFGFLASILNGGRCINGNLHKYIQVEVTITISGLLISIVTTIIFGNAPLEAIQMIWVNLVVAVLGGLALLTEPPSQKLMEKPPVRPSEPFITKAMWRNIIIQASYQVSILLAFQFKGQAILNFNEEVVFIEISHDTFGFARLNGPQWSICFLIGALSWVTDGAVNITWAVIKVKLRRSSSLAGSEPPRSTGILELPLIAQNSSPPASY
ncbi:hypothetical protein D5086_028656 [Populus alba]|uniref:Uncharacterized protein n=1 Tax=Populus alba TaxID=43335 RepID=A0ACC4ARG4_POPAL